MIVTISHQKTITQAMGAADCAADEILRILAQLGIQAVNHKKRWTGQVMVFEFTAKLAFLTYPIRGTVEVTSSQFILNLELGFIRKLLPEARAKASIESRVPGLLN